MSANGEQGQETVCDDAKQENSGAAGEGKILKYCSGLTQTFIQTKREAFLFSIQGL